MAWLAVRDLRRRQQEAPSGADGWLEIEASVPEPSVDPLVADALRALPPRRRLVIFLHYFADLSYAEIAELCDVSEGTVAATLSQAREAVRIALEVREGARR